MKTLMFKLPDYEVIIHIQQNEFSSGLEKQINALSTGFFLENSTEYCGRKDYHWVFQTWELALEALDKLKSLIDNPNLLLLEARSNCDPKISPICLKNLIK